MQTSKFQTAICAIAVCASLVSVRAQDNPAQAAARAALMEKLNTPAAPAPAITNAEPSAAVAPAAPAAIVMTPAATPPPAPAASAPVAAAPVASDTAGDSAAQAAARAALLEKMATSDSQHPATTATVPGSPAPVAAAPVQPATVSTSGQHLEFTPIVAPALPISMTKEAQLQALNAKYIANQIAPQDYFKQRAAILAQP